MQKILQDFFCSKVFLGVDDGIDGKFGLTAQCKWGPMLNRQMIAVSQRVIVLADSIEFGKKGFGKICGIEEVNQVITDSGIPEHFVRHLESLGIEVTIV